MSNITIAADENSFIFVGVGAGVAVGATLGVGVTTGVIVGVEVMAGAVAVTVITLDIAETPPKLSVAVQVIE